MYFPSKSVNSLLNGGLAVLPSKSLKVLRLQPIAMQCVNLKLKGRPPSNPLIVHVLDLDMAKKWSISLLGREKLSLFLAGPLTLVLNKKNCSINRKL